MKRCVLAFVIAMLPALGLAARAVSHQDPAGLGDLVRGPELSAKKLYDAWQKKDRAAAFADAETTAVAKLFARLPQPMTLTRCQRTDEGFYCIYRDPKTAFEVWIRTTGGASAGYFVNAVFFSTD
jgi:hypothetical protein